MNVAPQHSDCWITSALSAYERPLLRYVNGFVVDLEIAREITQETFLRLCNKSKSGDAENIQKNVKAWLFRVARNASIDWLRKEKRMQATDSQTIDQLMESKHPTQDPVVAQEQASVLGKELGQLPASQQEVIKLRFENQLSYKAIAEVTGTTVSNVGFILHTAIKKLRAAMLTDDP